MKKFNLYSRILTFALAVLATFTIATATPSSPYNLSGQFAYLQGDTDNPYDLILSWSDTNDVNTIDGFIVYFGEVGNDGPLVFTILDYTEERSIRISPSESLDLVSKSYLFYVEAYDSATTSDGSNFVSAVMGRNYNDGDITDEWQMYMCTITSRPEIEGATGREYAYDVDIIQDKSSKKYYDIEFDLTNAPEGMEIDNETGLISWLPENSGRYNIEVVTKIDDKIQTKQLWSVDVEMVNSVEDIPESEISIYPNPSSDYIKVNFNSVATTAKYQIINIEGNVLKSGTVFLQPGNNNLSFNTMDLGSGNYILRINGENVNLSKSFIVTN